MVKWLDVVKSTMEKNKGKPLKEILPIAKIEWQKLKKTGQVVVSTVSNVSKKIKGGKTLKSKSKSKSNSNVDLSIQQTHSAAPVMAQMAMPMGRARGKTRGKTRAGKGKRKGGKSKSNKRNKTRRVAGKGGKHKKSKSNMYDITSINLK
jgi:hypothetical protein